MYSSLLPGPGPAAGDGERATCPFGTNTILVLGAWFREQAHEIVLYSDLRRFIERLKVRMKTLKRLSVSEASTERNGNAPKFSTGVPL